MNRNKSIAYNVGLGLTYLSVALFIVLAVCKITGGIAWSWWWVLAPILIPFGIAFVTVLASTIIIGIMTPPKYNQEDEEKFNK